jgi:hypothetical protein
MDDNCKVTEFIIHPAELRERISYLENLRERLWDINMADGICRPPSTLQIDLEITSLNAKLSRTYSTLVVSTEPLNAANVVVEDVIRIPKPALHEASLVELEPTGLVKLAYSRLPEKTRLPVLQALQDDFKLTQATRGPRCARIEYRKALIITLFPLWRSLVRLKLNIRKGKPE